MMPTDQTTPVDDAEIRRRAAEKKPPPLDAATQPAIPLAQTPLPNTAASSQVTPPAQQAPTPGTGPALPIAGATVDPMAFTPPPGAAPVTATPAPSVNPNATTPPTTLSNPFDPANQQWRNMATTEQQNASSAAFNTQTAGQDAKNWFTDVPNLIRNKADLAPGTTIGDPNSTDPLLSGKEFWDSTIPFNTPPGETRGPSVPGGGAPLPITQNTTTVTPTDGSTLPDLFGPDEGSNTDPSRIALPTGPANDVGQGGQQPDGGTLAGPYTDDPIQDAISQASNNTTSNGASTLTPVTPDTALTNFRISAGPQTDRFKIAQDRFDASAKASDPAYQATLRDQNRYNFGAGRGVSGAARNSMGDIATQRTNKLDTDRQMFLSNALEGSIGDAYRNIGIDERQQEFQSGQQKTGFSQNMAIEELTNARTDAEFQQAMQKLIMGSEGDPARLQMLLASIFGGQSAQSADAAVRLAET